MSKYFSINGFWKEDKVKFSNYIVSEIDDEPQVGDPYSDEDIFFEGITEDEIKQAIIDNWDSDYEFVITSYEEIKLDETVEYAIIAKAREIMKKDFMSFPDYDPHTRTTFDDALTILVSTHLPNVDTCKIYDCLTNKIK